MGTDATLSWLTINHPLSWTNENYFSRNWRIIFGQYWQYAEYNNVPRSGTSINRHFTKSPVTGAAKGRNKPGLWCWNQVDSFSLLHRYPPRLYQAGVCGTVSFCVVFVDECNQANKHVLLTDNAWEPLIVTKYMSSCFGSGLLSKLRFSVCETETLFVIKAVNCYKKK